MKLADVTFPGTFSELTAMGSAELRVLVGKLPNGTDLHPKIASMGYHMTKAERLDFLGWHYYNTGSPEAAGKALANGQVKYAEHQAKKGNKTGAKVTKAPSAPSTNCTASAATQLANLGQAVPIDTKLAADLNGWAKMLTGSPSKAELKTFSEALSTGSAASDAVGPALDNIFDLDDVVGNWLATLNALDGTDLGDTWLTSQLLAKSAKKVQGLSPDFASAASAQAATASTDAVISALDKVTNLANLGSGTMQERATALAALLDTDLTKLPFPTSKFMLEAAADSTEKLTKITNAATQGDLSFTELFPQLPTTLADDLATKVTAYKAALPTQYADEIIDMELAGLGDLGSAIADNVAQTAAKAAAAEAAQAAEAAAGAIDSAKATYAAMSKAELKKLGPPAFKDAGVDVPSLAHYLTKDELAEALAKIDAGQPITDLVEVAQAKKVAHKAGATATQKAEKVPGSPSPALQANPTTADAIDLPPADVATKAAKDALPATADDVEALSVPELGPPPDVTPLAPQSKYPKPAQTQHSWTPKANQPNLGGAHTKHVYTDEDANVWMWKKAETEGVAKGEVLAHDIGWDLGFDMSDIRYADGWQVPGKGKFAHGTVQKFHQGVKGDMTKVPISAMTPEQLAELQEHQVFDWLISQHDTHTENILVMADGHLVPIDKGQAFKFFGNDKLEVGWMPQGNFGRPVYYDLWDEYAAGRLDLDLDAIDGILARIEQTADAAYEARVRAYVKQRMDDGGRSLSFLPPGLRTEDELVQAIMGRKASIRDDFTEFYKAQAKRRGVKWEPIWERRLAAAGPEKVAELGSATVSAGITTPITQQLANDVQKFGGGGKAVHLAGKDVNGGQVLVYVEQGVDGKPILRMELRLEPAAEQRVTTLLRSIKDDTAGAVKTTGGGGALPDPEWNTVLAYAKTVGAHASDGAYNASTVQAAKTLAGQLDGKINEAEALAKQALDAGDVDTWATQLAQAEKLGTYTKHLDDITKAMDAGTTPSYKATQFDADQAKKTWLAKAPKAPATKTAEPAPSIFSELKVGQDRMQRTEPTDGFMQFRRTGEEPVVRVGSHYSYDSGFKHNDPGGNSVGRQFDGKLDVNGTTVGMHYRGYDMTAAVPRKGLIDLEIPDWDGSPEAIEQMLAAVDRLGVDVRLATAEDEALTYWRSLTGSMKQSVEYANHSSGSGPYARIKETIDDIEAKIAKAGNLTSAQEADLYREGFTEVFGADTVGRAAEGITHRRNIFGEEMGVGHVRRFDLPEDISTFWSKTQAGHVHGSGRITGDQFSTYDGASSTSELVRHGTIKLDGSTTSAEADLYTGGASGTFSSPGWSGYANGRDFVIGRPAAIDVRASTFAHTGDRFGALGERVNGNYLDPAKSIRSGIGSGESVTRDSISFGEDVEAVVVRSKVKQKEMLADLRSMGVTEIRGRPIEERVLYARTDSDARDLVQKITAERKESMFNPYADIPGGPRTEPGLPPAPKPKRTRKPKAPAPEPDAPLATASPQVDPFQVPPLNVDASKVADAFTKMKPYAAADLAGKSTMDLKIWGTDKLAKSLGIPPEDAIKLWYKAIGQVSLDDPVMAAQYATEWGAQYHALATALEKLDTISAKAEYLTNLDGWGTNLGAKTHLAELVGKEKYGQVVSDWSSMQNGPNSVLGYIKEMAAELDGAATPSVAKAAEAAGKLATDQVSNAGWVTAAPGQKVAADAAEKVFNYAIPGVKGKLPVQFIDLGSMGSKIIAQHSDGEWYMVADAVGKTNKDQLIEKLYAMGWPDVKAPVLA